MNTLLLLFFFFLGIFLCFYLKYKTVIESLENCDPSKPLVYGDKAKEIYGNDVNRPSSKQCETAASKNTSQNISTYKVQLNEVDKKISKISTKVDELYEFNAENEKYTKQLIASLDEEDGDKKDIDAGESVDLRADKRKAINGAANQDKPNYKIPGL